MEIVQPGGSGSGTALTVTDGITPVVNVSTINFTSGATVTNGGGGQANVAITGGGGTGISVLNSTETPNGILTVFTFAGAAAQPSFLVSDNVWMRATTKGGTIQWTWNAGAKTATLTIPPVDEIFAIV